MRVVIRVILRVSYELSYELSLCTSCARLCHYPICHILQCLEYDISRSQCISLFGLYSPPHITPCVIFLLEPSTDKNRQYTFMCTNTLTSYHLYDSSVPQCVATTTRGTCGTGKQPLTNGASASLGGIPHLRRTRVRPAYLGVIHAILPHILDWPQRLRHRLSLRLPTPPPCRRFTSPHLSRSSFIYTTSDEEVQCATEGATSLRP